jgi:hypothetical protein
MTRDNGFNGVNGFRSLVGVFFIGLVLGSGHPAWGATVAHEGFDSPTTVDSLLTAAGHTSTGLTPAQIEGGILVSSGASAFDVFVISRGTTFLGSSMAYADAVQDYIDAGGNIVTEWSGGNMFFSSYASDIRPTSDNQPQLGTFQGSVHAGGPNAFDTPINILDTSHPTVQGIANPHMEEDGTEFFFWVENPDANLEVVADFVGSGEPGFPLEVNLPTLMVGCSGGATFVIATWDWNDTLGQGAGNDRFLTNAVGYAATNSSCVPEDIVRLEIMPGTTPNFIDPDIRAKFPIAILGSESFDVADVDVNSLRFGPAGALPFLWAGVTIEDLGEDGFQDLVVYFRIEETGIAAGDDQACITGNGLIPPLFVVCDAIVTPTPVEAATAPVPEPGQLWQLMSGLAGLGSLYRLRRRAQRRCAE